MKFFHLTLNTLKTHSLGHADSTLGPAHSAGLGEAATHKLWGTLYKRLMGAENYLSEPVTTELNGIPMKHYKINTGDIPQPLRRWLVQLKCSKASPTNEPNVGGMAQFIGGLDSQYIYLLEHGKDTYLAHNGKILAHRKA